MASAEGDHGSLSFFDILTSKRLGSAIELSAPSQSVAARPGKPEVGVLTKDGVVRVFDSKSREERKQLKLPKWFWASWQNAVQSRLLWTPDGSRLIALTCNGLIVVYDSENLEKIHEIEPNEVGDLCKTLTVSQDSQFLAAGIFGGQHEFTVYDLTTGKQLIDSIPEPMLVTTVAFSPDGRFVLTGNKDKAARLYDWKSRSLVLPPFHHESPVVDTAFTRDGKFCLTITDQSKLSIWEIATGKRITKKLDLAPGAEIRSLAVLESRVVINHYENPIVDLNLLVTDPRQTLESLDLLAELTSGRQIVGGEIDLLKHDEWLDRWERFKKSKRSMTDVAINFAGRLDAARLPAAKRSIVDQAALSVGVLAELAKMRPQEPELRVAINQQDSNVNLETRRDNLANVISLYQQRLEATKDAFQSSQVARRMASLLLAANQPEWQPAKIESAESVDSLNIQDDGSILADGDHSAGAVYSIKFTANIPQIGSLKLEVLPHQSLPSGGPGTHPTGNFHLAKLEIATIRKPALPQFLALRSAWCSYQFPNPEIDVRGTILDDDPRVWHVWGRLAQSHFAVFNLDRNVDVEADQPLLVKIHNTTNPTHNIGCFRLFVRSTPTVDHIKMDRLIESRQFGASESLALAWSLVGNHANALKQLDRSTSPSGINEGLRHLIRYRAYDSLREAEKAKEARVRLQDWQKNGSLPELFDPWIPRP